MSGTHADPGHATPRRTAIFTAALAAILLASCQSSDTPAGAEGERAAERADRKALRIEKTSVQPRRLGDGFVDKGLPLVARVGRAGKLKGKVVVKARTARRLGLWPNPSKMKPRSVAKRRVTVKRGQKRTLLLRPHGHYRDEFRRAPRAKLRRARYQLRAVLRNRKGRKVARIAKPIRVRTARG